MTVRVHRRLAGPIALLLFASLAMHAAPTAAIASSNATARHTHLGAHEAATDTGKTAPDTTKSKDDAAAWRVNTTHGPADTVHFDVHEGTWMSVDVSPDGRTLVFDLLGDLYTLPIAGGTARRITSGPAWDYTPRWSPDGKRLLFTSDRGGCDNVWVSDADGSHMRPVTSEKRVVNQPAWSPDGEWVACKKRITDYSSLGTAELWLVNVRGGDGVQITAKGDLPEAGEPVFSRDGRYVYFSARPSRYGYDRNVFAGIYQIRRWDRSTGESVTLTDGFGGSCRPVLAPDGKSLAFVRRDRLRTVLGIYDLERRTERIIWNGLDDDLMEGFAFNGVYPNFAFTPDGRSIVVSGGGQLNRVDVATGKATVIPFTAHVEQVIAQALRFPRAIANDAFRVRMISWPTWQPDSRRAVFAAVGSLWSVALPNGKLPLGTPVKLATSGGHAYAPAFSRDGRTLAYVSWNDTEGGQLWAMPARGGSSKRLTRVASQYANPAFSPDGSKLVLVRGDNAAFRGHDLGDEGSVEIVWVSATGGDVHHVTDIESRGSARRMPRVFWDARGERIFFTSTERLGPSKEKTSLYSIRPDGTDKVEHLQFGLAEEIVPSPDGKWAAYTEQFNAYLTALPEVGRKTVEISGEAGPVPVKKFTADQGADWVNWADGGKSITWSFGPKLYRVQLDSVLAFWDRKALEAGEKAAVPAPGAKKADAAAARIPTDTLEVALWLPRAKPAGTYALTGGRLITMRGDEVIENGTIVVSGDRIVAAGPSSQVTIPAGARTFDCKGKTLMPGMIDTHAHLHYNTLDILPEQEWSYWCNLAFGVTTTHDPSASNYTVFTQSEMVEAGLMKGPRTWSTGYILYGADGAGKATINSAEDARNHLKRLKTLGAFSVKSYMQPRREQRQWIIAAARAESMLVVPEGGGNIEMDLTHVVDGHTSNEHALPVTPIRDDVAQLFGRSGTVETPTLLVAYGGLSGEHWFYQHYEAWKHEKLLRFYPRGALDARAIRRPVMSIDGDWHHFKVAEGCKRILDRGGKITLGAHGQLQGLGPHWELWGLTQGGISNHDALRAATLSGAWELGMDKDLGSLEVGKLADVVIMDQNPLEKIQNSDSIRWVVKNGEVFDGQTMDQLWPVAKPCPKFTFQTLGGGERKPDPMP